MNPTSHTGSSRLPIPPTVIFIVDGVYKVGLAAGAIGGSFS
jgi:hypothetical protein